MSDGGTGNGRADTRFKGLEAGVSLLLDEVTALRGRVAALEGRLDRLRLEAQAVDARSAATSMGLDGVKANYHDLEVRVSRLEAQQSDDGR